MFRRFPAIAVSKVKGALTVLTPTTLVKILGSKGMTIGTGTLVNGRSSTATVLCYAPTANPGDSQVITNCLVGEIRYSGARRVDLADGVVHNAGVNGIIYYDTYVNGTVISPKPVILAEKESTNSSRYSFNVTGSVSKMAVTTPNINTVVVDSTTAIHRIMLSNPVSTVSGEKYTFSALVEYVDIQYIYLNFNAHIAASACFDIVNGTYVMFGATLSAKIIQIGSKFLCSITGIAATSNVSNSFIQLNTISGQDDTWLGDGIKSIKIHAIQKESGESFTSFIETTTVAVTRAADSINIPYTGNFTDKIIFAMRINRSIASPTASAETYLSATGRTILAKAAAGTTLNLTDGTNTATVAIPGTTQTDYIFAFVADTALAQMAVLVSGDGGSTWTTGTASSYDGSFNGSSVLSLLPTIAAPTNIIGVMTKSQPFGSITAATDWIKANATTELS